MKYSSLRNSSLLSFADKAPLDAPLILYVETINKCNYKCTYSPESLAEYSNITGNFSQLSLSHNELVSQQILYATQGPGVEEYLGRLPNNAIQRRPTNDLER
jgi:hypothetical protein